MLEYGATWPQISSLIICNGLFSRLAGGTSIIVKVIWSERRGIFAAIFVDRLAVNRSLT